MASKSRDKRRDKRRDNGDGAVYATADGRWRGALIVAYTPDGKPKKRYVSGPTEAAVKKKLRKLRSDVEQGKVATDPGDTVSAWLAYWLENVAKPRVKPNTYAGYKTAVHHWAIPHFGPKLKLERLAVEQVEHLYAAMREQGRSTATIRLVHRVLTDALTTAYRRGKLGQDIADLLDAPGREGEDPEVEPLTVAEARDVLAAAAGRRNEARWSVAMALGLRQGESLALEWESIDLDAGTLTVRWQLQRITGHGLQMVPVKSRAGRARVIGLPPTLVEALRAQRRRQLAERMREGSRWVGWETEVPFESGHRRRVDLVFPTLAGQPMDRRADWEAWKELLGAAGVKPRSTASSRAAARRKPAEAPAAPAEPAKGWKAQRKARGDAYNQLPPLHAARHTCATLLLLQGINGRVVMEILGWSKLSMVERYQHVVSELRGQAAEAIEGALWGGSSGSRTGSNKV